MIPIFEPDELKAKHDRLKLLQKGLAGKYLNNRLGGVITRINLGYYLYGAACIINSLTVSIPDEASWDWGVDGDPNMAYAMLLEANFQITVIDETVAAFEETKKETTPPPAPKPGPAPKPRPKPTPKPAPLPTPKTINIPRPVITADNTLTKFTPTNVPRGGTYGGTNAAQGANAIKLKQKQLTEAQNKALVDKLSSKKPK